ncbi:MAG TPA: hypothetical protein PLP19_18475 [bacterium]|mgnify:CR=1 FL=1|nr:hypothetical protein [bacterium]HPN45484.1 hypothetical protein [bacterium]
MSPWSPRTGDSKDYSSEVALASFVVIASKQSVVLNWVTAHELGNIGFSIERRFIEDENWLQIGFISGQGKHFTQHEYNYEDHPGKTGLISYRLRQTSADGSYNYSRPVSVSIKKNDIFTLFQNYPNPFIESTSISFQLPEDVKNNVLLKIQNMLNEDVRKLYDKPAVPGYYNIEWNSLNEKGQAVSPGVYNCILETDAGYMSKKIVKISFKPPKE